MRQKSHTLYFSLPKIGWLKVVSVSEGVIYMVQWRFKSCPRCLGDLFISSDIDGWYEQCLQCAYRHGLKNPKKFQKYPTPIGGKRPKK